MRPIYAEVNRLANQQQFTCCLFMYVCTYAGIEIQQKVTCPVFPQIIVAKGDSAPNLLTDL